MASDTHIHLVARARSRDPPPGRWIPHAKLTGHDAAPAPTPPTRHPVYHPAVPRCAGAPGAQTGPFLAWELPPPDIGVCWGILGWRVARHGASWGVARKSMKTW